MNLLCLLHGHDDMRIWRPGHVLCQCQRCGRESVGLRGPISPVVKPVVRSRKLRPQQPKPKPLKVVARRKLA
jgi:hypothetical protein